jgi:hypothetical protein
MLLTGVGGHQSPDAGQLLRKEKPTTQPSIQTEERAEKQAFHPAPAGNPHPWIAKH